jgi:Arc/MetJ-type ribon-helix-helix transcriptional regulator
MAKLSANIPKDHKDKITVLIEKGMFENYSDFGRRAVRRFLEEIDEYKDKKEGERVEKVTGKPPKEKPKGKPAAEKHIEDARDIARFADEIL